MKITTANLNILTNIQDSSSENLIARESYMRQS